MATATQENRKMTVKEKVDGIRGMLDKSREQIAMALPRHLTPERMLRVTMTAIQRSPSLLECDPRTLIGCIVQASQLGLEPDGILGHAYLVPFRNKKTGNKEVQLIPGYKGLVELSRRSGQISTVYAKVVNKADHYDFSYGLEPKLDHRPADVDDPGEVVAVYAVARLKDGGIQFEWLWRREIDKIRKQSKASDSGPWVTHFEEMAKKTALRRLCKLLPVSIEIQRIVALDEHAEVGRSQRMDSVVDFDAAKLPAPANDIDQLTDRLSHDNGTTVDAEAAEQPVEEIPPPLAEYAEALAKAPNVDEVGLAYYEHVEKSNTLSDDMIAQAVVMRDEAKAQLKPAEQKTLV